MQPFDVGRWLVVLCCLFTAGQHTAPGVTDTLPQPSQPTYPSRHSHHTPATGLPRTFRIRIKTFLLRCCILIRFSRGGGEVGGGLGVVEPVPGRSGPDVASKLPHVPLPRHFTEREEFVSFLSCDLN